jgi:hypothetical protein
MGIASRFPALVELAKNGTTSTIRAGIYQFTGC